MISTVRSVLDEPRRQVLVTVVTVLVATGCAAVLGRFAATDARIAVAASLAALGVGITAVSSSAVPLVSLPFLFVVLRLGAGGVDLSISDFVLAIAAVPALIMAPRPYAKELRLVLWLSAAYQFATLLTVVNNPYLASVVEWAHAWLLVSGSLLVGWAVGAGGHAKAALRLVMVTVTALALVTIAQGVVQVAHGDLGPVYPSWPYGMHKNFIGAVCGMGAGVVYAKPSWLGWSRRVLTVLFSVNLIAVVFSQSRQALIGLVAVIIVLILRGKGEHRRSKVTLLVAVPILLFVTNLVQDQIQSGNRFNSVFQRLTWFQDSVSVWQTDPWFGVGLRWWYTDRFPVSFQPPNAEIEVLTSAGVVGLVAFLVLMLGALAVAWRMDPTYGSVAVAVIVGRLVQAQFDLFWVAVQASVPFVILGMCLGVQHLARSATPATTLPKDVGARS